MVNTRLVLINEQNVTDDYNLNTAVISDIGVKINLEIGDIRTPEKKSGSFTENIVIAGTPEVNNFFENVFKVNISLQKFDPRKKVKAIYYANEEVQFTGYLRIVSIEIKDCALYQCSIIGQVTNFFLDIRDQYLTDLYNNATLTALGYDLSNYDSGLTVSKSDIVASWANLGDGYVYPLIDWGGFNSDTNKVKVSDLRGCFFAWGYLFRIFTAAGYTWTSNFIDSTFFKRLIITPTKYAELSDTVLNANKFLAVANGSEVFNKSLNSTSYPFLTYSETSVANVNFQSETYDTGNRFSTPTYTTDPAVSYNTYNIKANLSLSFVVKKGASDVSGSTSINSGQVKIYVYKGSSQIAMNILDLTTATLGSTGSNNISIDIPNYGLAGNQALTVKIQFTSVILSATAGTGTYTLDATVKSGSNFSSEFSTKQLFEGMSVQTIDFIPENVKQSDFVSWLIRMFNLQFMVDPNNEKNIIIEPWEDWASGEVDWTQKHDELKPITVIPCGELDFRELQYRYKQDADYFNTIHLAEYTEPYGSEDVLADTEFSTEVRKIEVGFSPTPIAKTPYSNTVLSTIIKKDNGVVAQTKSNPRILYWAGLTTFSQQPQSWYLLDSSGATYYGQVPWAGHVDNPFAPTVDLNWGLPDKVYYTYPNQTWTTKNLVNKYWSKFNNQVTDKNSKIVQAWFNLTPRDIRNIDFRKVIFWKDAYYFLNKVINYDVIKRSSTLCELVKLKDYDNFTESTVEFNGGLGGSENSWERTANSGISNGVNNINNGESSYILGGENNFISPGAESVTLVNCENVVVEGDVVNFVGSNLSNITITHSMSNKTLNGSETPIEITSNTTLDKSYHNKTVYVDATAGDITLTWDCINMNGVEVRLVRKDSSANIIYITDAGGYGTESYVGNSLPYDLGLVQYDSIDLRSNTDTIYS